MVELDCNIEELGIKAFNLYRMQSAGIRVPRFFVLSHRLLHEDENIIQQKISQELSKTATRFYAVRSSSNLEDGKNASFAGLFNTILNVPQNDVMKTVVQVFSSANSCQLHEYCKSKNISVDKVSINVIVQEQINSISSGICITCMDFSPDCLYIEACRGQCAAITDGKIVPSSYQIKRRTREIIATDCVDQSFYLACIKSGGLQEVYNKINVQVLSKKQLIEIANTALKIEQSLDMDAVDMEWTFDKQGLYILQARPYVRI